MPIDNSFESYVSKIFDRMMKKEEYKKGSWTGAGTCIDKECDRRRAGCAMTYEQAMARNERLLKDLAVSRARLRTYAAYSPTEQQLQALARAYWWPINNHRPKLAVLAASDIHGGNLVVQDAYQVDKKMRSSDHSVHFSTARCESVPEQARRINRKLYAETSRSPV
ncbi:hypothetical protein KM043_018559 [Ampulex compressa]|nr:hypothetical protein KM043_018559 [Ampulex compressa]